MEPLNSGPVSTRLWRIAELAREHPERVFRSLSHVIDMDFLKEAHRRTRKDGAVGVDGQTADEYAADLEGNLQSLLDRLKSNTYRAPRVRRVHLPKGDGRKTRLIHFGPPRQGSSGDDTPPKPGSFDLLGFTHYWAKSCRGYWVVKQKTASIPAGPRPETGTGLVPEEPAPSAYRTARCAGAEAARPLRLLRHHRQLLGTGSLLSRGLPHLAQMADAAVELCATVLGLVERVDETHTAPASSCRAQRLPSVSERRTLRSRMRESRTSGSVGALGG